MNTESQFMYMVKHGIFCYSNPYNFYVSNLVVNIRMLNDFIDNNIIKDFSLSSSSGYDITMSQTGMDLKKFTDL